MVSFDTWSFIHTQAHTPITHGKWNSSVQHDAATLALACVNVKDKRHINTSHTVPCCSSVDFCSIRNKHIIHRTVFRSSCSRCLTQYIQSQTHYTLNKQKGHTICYLFWGLVNKTWRDHKNVVVHLWFYEFETSVSTWLDPDIIS